MRRQLCIVQDAKHVSVILFSAIGLFGINFCPSTFAKYLVTVISFPHHLIFYVSVSRPSFHGGNLTSEHVHRPEKCESWERGSIAAKLLLRKFICKYI
jgi:hypothetical protein